MSRLLLFLLIAATAAQAQAPDYPGRKDFESYTGSPSFAGYLQQAFNAIEPAALKAECPTLKVVSLDSYSMLDPPTFVIRDNVKTIDTGRWISRVTVDRCGTTFKRRALMVALPGKNLVQPIWLLPGDFKGNLSLERDARKIVYQAILVQAHCSANETPVVVDIKAAQVKEARWEEDWTSLACGKTVTTHVVYIRDDTGTTISAEIKRAAP